MLYTSSESLSSVVMQIKSSFLIPCFRIALICSEVIRANRVELVKLLSCCIGYCHFQANQTECKRTLTVLGDAPLCSVGDLKIVGVAVSFRRSPVEV